MSVTVTLDERDLVAVINVLSEVGRQLTGAWHDTAMQRRAAIQRVLVALGAAHVSSTNSEKTRGRPILHITESVRDDGDLIALAAEAGSVLIESGQKGFAVRLMDSLLATRDFSQALHILENSCEVRWLPMKILGGYWRG